MLIHTTQLAELHTRYRDPLLGEVAAVRALISRETPKCSELSGTSETDAFQRRRWESGTSR